MILQHFADGILSGAIVSLGAIGLSFTMKMLRFANFSHSELLTWGAYSALVFVSFFSVSALLDEDFSLSPSFFFVLLSPEGERLSVA